MGGEGPGRSRSRQGPLEGPSPFPTPLPVTLSPWPAWTCCSLGRTLPTAMLFTSGLDGLWWVSGWVFEVYCIVDFVDLEPCENDK